MLNGISFAGADLAMGNAELMLSNNDLHLSNASFLVTGNGPGYYGDDAVQYADDAAQYADDAVYASHSFDQYGRVDSWTTPHAYTPPPEGPIVTKATKVAQWNDVTVDRALSVRSPKDASVGRARVDRLVGREVLTVQLPSGSHKIAPGGVMVTRDGLSSEKDAWRAARQTIAAYVDKAGNGTVQRGVGAMVVRSSGKYFPMWFLDPMLEVSKTTQGARTLSATTVRATAYLAHARGITQVMDGMGQEIVRGVMAKPSGLEKAVAAMAKLVR